MPAESPVVDAGPRADEQLNWRTSAPFLLLHFVPLLAFVTGVTPTALALLAATFLGRMFFVTGGYHRYFSHRSDRLGRLTQFEFAFGGTPAARQGPLRWAAHPPAHDRVDGTGRDAT